MSTDQQIEQEIQAKGLTAPRVTPADIEANIAAEIYSTGLDCAAEAAGDQVGGVGVQALADLAGDVAVAEFVDVFHDCTSAACCCALISAKRRSVASASAMSSFCSA